MIVKEAPDPSRISDLNREEWLQSLRRELVPVFRFHGALVPEVHISTGFPSRKINSVIGQCWTREHSTDGKDHIFVSPFISDSVQVGAVLVHELIHAICGAECGHKGAFAALARKMGFEGKLTESNPGPLLRHAILKVLEKIGQYPHATLVNPETETKKGAGTPKAVCPEDEYTVSIARKWLDYGLPTCPCGTEMELA